MVTEKRVADSAGTKRRRGAGKSLCKWGLLAGFVIHVLSFTA